MLGGLSQSSENWKIIEDSNKDTLIVFTLSKAELTRLRVYMADLETHKELYYVEEEMNKNLQFQLEAYKNMIQAKDGTIVALQN